MGSSRLARTLHQHCNLTLQGGAPKAQVERIAASIEKDGPHVVVALRGASSRVTLTMRHRGAAALATLLRSAADGDDDCPLGDFTVRGELDTGVVT